MQYLVQLSVILSLLAGYSPRVARCVIPEKEQQFLHGTHENRSDQEAELVFSKRWQVLGPFRIGTRG